MNVNNRVACSGTIFSLLLLNSGVAVASDEMNTAQIVEKIGPAVVMVLSESSDLGPTGQGSGVLINDLSTIITNVHVVEGSKKVKIIFPDGQEFLVKGYISADENRDLVTIRLPDKVKEVSPVALDLTASIKIGQEVVAIGNPQGLVNTVSEGIISGVREFEPGTKILQTTAALSPGSSGGGLFSRTGKLLGVTSFLRRNGQNLNFAYPVEYAIPLLQGAASKPFSTLSSPSFATASKDEAKTVFVTRTGQKFHLSGCRHLRKSAIPVLLSNAISRYSPCKVCIGYN